MISCLHQPLRRAADVGQRFNFHQARWTNIVLENLLNNSWKLPWRHSPPKPTHYFLYSSYQASTNIYLAFINTVIIKLLLINCFVNKACRVFDKRNGAFNACYNVVKSTAPPFPWHLKRSRAVAWPLIGPGPGCCSLIGQWAAQGWGGQPRPGRAQGRQHRPQAASPGQDETTRAQSWAARDVITWQG